MALEQYVRMLLTANRRMNLISNEDTDAVWERHIQNSLGLLPHVGEAKRVADVGSGGGLPGIPLAISSPGTIFTLIEATGKKARFLEQTALILDLDNIRVVHARAETLGHQSEHREQYEIVTGRALAPLNVFLELTTPLCRVGGRILALKGEQAGEETNAAENATDLLRLVLIRSHQNIVGADRGGVILEYKKMEATPEKYPRRAGMPAKRPL